MTPEQITKAVTMRATGASYREIGAAIEVNHVTAYQNLKKDEINQLIKNAQNDLLKNSLQTAIDSQSDKILYGADIARKIANKETLTDGAVKLLELGHDCEKQILQSVGIHNAHTQSITLNQILVDNRTELSPAVESMLVSHFKNISGANVVDAEIIEPVEGNEVA
jgi:hypothetical protein